MLEYTQICPPSYEEFFILGTGSDMTWKLFIKDFASVCCKYNDFVLCFILVSSIQLNKDVVIIIKNVAIAAYADFSLNGFKNCNLHQSAFSLDSDDKLNNH